MLWIRDIKCKMLINQTIDVKTGNKEIMTKKYGAKVTLVDVAFDGTGFKTGNGDYSMMVTTDDGDLLIDCDGLDSIDNPGIYAINASQRLKDSTIRFIKQNRKPHSTIKEYASHLVNFLNSL